MSSGAGPSEQKTIVNGVSASVSSSGLSPSVADRSSSPVPKPVGIPFNNEIGDGAAGENKDRRSLDPAPESPKRAAGKTGTVLGNDLLDRLTEQGPLLPPSGFRSRFENQLDQLASKKGAIKSAPTALARLVVIGRKLDEGGFADFYYKQAYHAAQMLEGKAAAASAIIERLEFEIAYKSPFFAFWQRFSFTVLVLVSFYLGLCALLAIPLFQEKATSQTLSVEALGKALDANIMKPELFDLRFPVEPPSLSQPKLTVQIADRPGSGSDQFNDLLRTQSRIWEGLKELWTALRITASTGPAAWRDQAVHAFTAGLEVGAGKKQTAQHYNDLFLWHQRASQSTRNALIACHADLASFVFNASQTSESMRLAIVRGEADFRSSDALGNQAIETAYRNCQWATDQRPAIPPRPSFADALGPVGSWSRWLLDTEQMPVVIIVGLVGFSLLGATVSRAVRSADESLKTRFAADDLATVIAGGMTAAVIVFLAAYGGLAVLGNSGGDPNPYVVFVTCLIGAVYSEDVWSWARKRVRFSDAENRDQDQSVPRKTHQRASLRQGATVLAGS
jgi:hypothetical protein